MQEDIAMSREKFKDELFEILNEYGEDKMGMKDVDLQDREDLLIIELADGSKFMIQVAEIKNE